MAVIQECTGSWTTIADRSSLNTMIDWETRSAMTFCPSGGTGSWPTECKFGYVKIGLTMGIKKVTDKSKKASWNSQIYLVKEINSKIRPFLYNLEPHTVILEEDA